MNDRGFNLIRAHLAPRRPLVGCAGTTLTSEFVSLVVHDDSSDPTVALATPGLVVAPTRR
ncbi:MAG TPA: hypothetical protein VK672_04360 [Solirubrobacteraceae bacterium]|jgi:hypothetical protein|nr:hypothetical protein [Solirubrobacteraceae bacterium]